MLRDLRNLRSCVFCKCVQVTIVANHSDNAGFNASIKSYLLESMYIINQWKAPLQMDVMAAKLSFSLYRIILPYFLFLLIVMTPLQSSPVWYQFLWSVLECYQYSLWHYIKLVNLNLMFLFYATVTSEFSMRMIWSTAFVNVALPQPDSSRKFTKDTSYILHLTLTCVRCTILHNAGCHNGGEQRTNEPNNENRFCLNINANTQCILCIGRLIIYSSFISLKWWYIIINNLFDWTLCNIDQWPASASGFL